MEKRAPWTALALCFVAACGSSSSAPASTASGSGGASSTASGGGGGASATVGAGGASTTSTSAGTSSSTGAGGGPGLAAKYPGDVGIDEDPAVVWAENFEEGSVAAVTSRYDDAKNEAGMALVADVPAKSGGAASMKWTAGGGKDATDVYKRLPDHEELYVRWYAKYQKGITWHHTGVWVGGYNPPSNYPSPQAGLEPDGDDRFSVSIEPVYGIGGASPRLDFYDYWMQMHSWMAVPSGDTAYYGNSLVHQNGFTVDEDQWMCLEVHIRLNTDPASAAGGVLEVWKDDALVQHFDENGVKGYWIRDKFCPVGADGEECTDYPPDANTPMAPLDLRFRSTTSLKLNAFWPQNYITEGPEGAVQYDDMVVATARIGCLQ